MTNWIANGLDIKGDAEIINSLLQHFTTDPAENNTFSVLVEGQENPIYGFGPKVTRTGDKHVTVRFDTKGIPASHWACDLAEKYPALSIDFSYNDEWDESGGDIWFRCGKVEVQEFGRDLFRMKNHLERRLSALDWMAASSWESADYQAEKLQPYFDSLGHEAALKFFDEQIRIRAEQVAAHEKAKAEYHAAGGRPISMTDMLKMKIATRMPDREILRPIPIPINPDLLPPPPPVFNEPDFEGIIEVEDHSRRRAARMTERAEVVKAWDSITKHLTRFRYTGNEMDMTDWLNANCPKALTHHDEIMEDRDEDRLYIALDETDAAIFEAHWHDQISVCR